MSNLIDRQTAIDALMEIMDRPNHADFLYTDEICKTLNELPSAQPDACENTCEIELKPNDMVSKQAAIDSTMESVFVEYKSGFSKLVKQSINGDEYYTPQKAVDMIIPYVLKGGYKTIWCPFDKVDSKFVMTFKGKGFDVNYGHIETGQDFFEYQEPQGDIVVSNPPFSKRDKIFKRLYEWDIPFALIINFNGLFDSKKRVDIFRQHNVEMLVPRGRMKFYHRDKGLLNSPNFQSIYVCNQLLDHQIVFDETTF